jgi:ribosomal protein L37E
MKGPQRVHVKGSPLTCQVCGAETFDHRTATLTTSGIANSGFNKRSDLAVCSECGYVHTFLDGRLEWEP